MARVAVLTFGFLLERYGHPRVQGFFDRDAPIYATLPHAPGFIMRMDVTGREEAFARHYPHDRYAYAVGELSLWSDLESLFTFAYHGLHGEAFSKRREWAETPAQPNHSLWWVPDTHVPTWAEAFERQAMLGRDGPTPLAFNLKQPFDQTGAALPSVATMAQQARQGVE